MKVRSFYIFIFLATIFLPLPAFAQKSVKPRISSRVPSEKVRDAQLEAAIFSAVTSGDSKDKGTRYYYNRVDLNGDKKPEVLVYVFGGVNCGTGGCDVLLFQKVRGKYKLINNFGPTRNPVVVSRNKANGWHDLIFYNVGGGIIEGYYSVCRFNGRAYPENPTIKDEAPPLKTRVKGTEYLVGDASEKSGLSFSSRLLKRTG
ncbi:MAG: hypothetical protein M3209_04835 [Acidobacteriota bacterium]|nr:hypothetical protein [Acidobacteriota bacterium]